MKSINYIYFAENTGYGNAAKGLMDTLRKEHVQVYETAILPGNVQNGGILVQDEFITLVDGIIIHTVPEYYPYWLKQRRRTNSQIPVWGYTAWETDKIPSHWPEILNKMDGIFVPSQWNKEVFQQCGVEVPIVVLPHVSEFQGCAKEVELSNKLSDTLYNLKDGFLFYSINMWNERKDIPTLLQAFLEEFSEDEDVFLLLKTDEKDWSSYRSRWKRWPFQPAFQSSTRSFRQITSDQPASKNIIHITSHLSDDEIALLHKRGDCFVSCTRGEGWGMGAYEAAWFGNAVAITGYGGQLDFLPREYSYHFPYELIPVKTAYGSGSYDSQQRWANVDVGDARKILRTIVSNRTEAKRKGQQLRQYISGLFLPKQIANNCIEVFSHEENS